MSLLCLSGRRPSNFVLLLWIFSLLPVTLPNEHYLGPSEDMVKNCIWPLEKGLSKASITRLPEINLTTHQMALRDTRRSEDLQFLHSEYSTVQSALPGVNRTLTTFLITTANLSGADHDNGKIELLTSLVSLLRIHISSTLFDMEQLGERYDNLDTDYRLVARDSSKAYEESDLSDVRKAVIVLWPVQFLKVWNVNKPHSEREAKIQKNLEAEHGLKAWKRERYALQANRDAIKGLSPLLEALDDCICRPQ
ncbi:MAG: hypothetical protein Q9220_007673 [cf. Caloplaca sp. 1 TL-2023]